jgi:hypothetical protein
MLLPFQQIDDDDEDDEDETVVIENEPGKDPILSKFTKANNDSKDQTARKVGKKNKGSVGIQEPALEMIGDVELRVFSSRDLSRMDLDDKLNANIANMSKINGNI